MKHNWRKIILVILVLLALGLALELLFRPKVISNSWANGLYKMQRYESAARHFKRNADKEDDIAFANLGKSLYQQGKYKDALAPAEKAMQDKPKSASRNYDLGNIAYRQNDYKAALEHFRKAMMLDPQDRDAQANYELTQKKLEQHPPKSEPKPDQKQEQQQKQEDIRNILGGLDSKESSDRKSNQVPGAQGGDKWW